MISAAYPPVRAGEAAHAFHLCEQLAAAGLEIHVLTTKGIKPNDNSAIHLHPIMSSWSWSELKRLTRFTKSCAPDAVLLMYSGWLYKDHPMITFSPTFSKRISPKTRFVTQFEIENGAVINDRAIFSRLLRRAVKQWVGPSGTDWEFGTLFRDSDAVIVMSHAHQETVTQLFPNASTKITLLPPPPLMHLSSLPRTEARKQGRARLGINERDFLLAFFGYVYPRKGIDVTLRALRKLCDQRDDVRLVIIGGTEDDNTQRKGAYAQEMIRLATQLGINDKVTWSGEYETDSDLASICLLSADVCVLPFDQGVNLSRSSLAAAAAHGLPIITTRGKNLEPPFLDRKNVLLCPARDPEALADSVNELLSNVALRNQLSKGALELAARWFSWDRVVKHTMVALKPEA